MLALSLALSHALMRHTVPRQVSFYICRTATVFFCPTFISCSLLNIFQRSLWILRMSRVLNGTCRNRIRRRSNLSHFVWRPNEPIVVRNRLLETATIRREKERAERFSLSRARARAKGKTFASYPIFNRTLDKDRSDHSGSKLQDRELCGKIRFARIFTFGGVA